MYLGELYVLIFLDYNSDFLVFVVLLFGVVFDVGVVFVVGVIVFVFFIVFVFVILLVDVIKEKNKGYLDVEGCYFV